MPNPGIVTLLTDFGLRDGYVGVMKGVIATIHPEAKIIDIAHEIPPQDIRSAAFLIERSYRYFPEGTVHVVVVDPGVGSERKGLALSAQGHYFVGPDNGVFSALVDGAEIRALVDSEYWLEEVSSTFHGRDIFAPVAAHLAKGVSLEKLGPTHSDPARLETAVPERTPQGWAGEIVYVDRFGNLITNLGREAIENLPGESPVITLEDASEWPVVSTYSIVAPGARCAVVGGFDRLELSVNGGAAAEATGAKTGCRAILHEKVR